MTKVFLVTKLTTTNIGNQALSHEIIDLFKNKVGEKNLIVAGRPLGLSIFDFEEIKNSREPVKLFEKWADIAFRKYQKSSKKIIFQSHIKGVKLNTSESSELKYDSIKSLLRPLKRKLSKLAIYESVYENRLNQINSSDLLVYSGAGEVGDTNVFLRQLLEIRIAQKLGKRTAAVNQSVVVKTSVYEKLLLHVYGKMEKVVVRGQISIDLLIKCGINPAILALAPDTAILTKVPSLRKTNNKLVGINFTKGIKYDVKTAKKVIDHVKSFGNELIFITNEPIGDKKIEMELLEEFGIKGFPLINSYIDYAERLSEFKYLISTRLHTNILALSVNVPVIPIEGNIFKTTELLSQLKYPINVVNAYKENWEEVLIDEISKLENNEYNLNDYINDVLPQMKEDVKKNASWF